MSLKMIKSRQGFTLIEILIVVAIIAILAGIVLVGLQPAQQQGADARRIADLNQVRIAAQLYYNIYGSYPDDFAGLKTVVPDLPEQTVGNASFGYSPMAGNQGYVVGVQLGGQKPLTAGGLVTSGSAGSLDCSQSDVYCIGFGAGVATGGTTGGTNPGGTNPTGGTNPDDPNYCIANPLDPACAQTQTNP